MSGLGELALVQLPEWLLLGIHIAASEPGCVHTKASLAKEIYIRLRAVQLHATPFECVNDEEATSQTGELVMVHLPKELLLDIQSVSDSPDNANSKIDLAEQAFTWLSARLPALPLPFDCDNDEEATSPFSVDGATQTSKDKARGVSSPDMLGDAGMTASDNEFREVVSSAALDNAGKDTSKDVVPLVYQNICKSASREQIQVRGYYMDTGDEFDFPMSKCKFVRAIVEKTQEVSNVRRELKRFVWTKQSSRSDEKSQRITFSDLETLKVKTSVTWAHDFQFRSSGLARLPRAGGRLMILNIMIYDNRVPAPERRDKPGRGHRMTPRHHEKLEKHSARAQLQKNYIRVTWLSISSDATFDDLKRQLCTHYFRCIDVKDLELYKSLRDRGAGRQANDDSSLRKAGISNGGKVYLW